MREGNRTRRIRRRIMSAVLCIAIVGAGAGVLAISSQLSGDAAGASAPEPDNRRANVRVETVKTQLVEDILELTGTVMPWEDITLSAETAGRIEVQAVDEGARIQADQVLFRVDTQSIRAQLDQARAQLTLAAREFERMQQLAQRGASPARDADSAVASRDVAAAEVRALEIMLAKSEINAPIDGVVDTVYRKVGEYVDPGAPLVRIVQINPVKVVVGVPERDRPQFESGNTVRVRLDALPGQTFEGTIYRIATTAEASTHTFRTEIQLDNESGTLKPGMIARLQFVRAAYPDSILVPMFAVISLEDGRLVYVEEDGRAEPRTVETGVFRGADVQILSGLAPGDRLIVSGQRGLRPGEAVDVREATP